jgi:DNA-binding XRE family transcriptional regulator
MRNIVIGYRNMIPLTQIEMAKELNISELTYRNKEQGKVPFKDFEMVKFRELLKKVQPNITIEDIFFGE